MIKLYKCKTCGNLFELDFEPKDFKCQCGGEIIRKYTAPAISIKQYPKGYHLSKKTREEYWNSGDWNKLKEIT